MNTLRVWGGAIWEPESFYDAADEFGIIIYHDAQFLNGGTTFDIKFFPRSDLTFLTRHALLNTGLQPYGVAGVGVRGSASERNELEYQLARLSHHPSIAMWDACNECGGRC